MNINDKFKLTTSYVVLTDNIPDPSRAYASSIAKHCLCIVTAMILLMADSALSAVIDDIKADMQQLNEVKLLNAPSSWPKGGAIHMGSAPRGDASPTFWTPSNLAFKSATPWSAIAPWFVMWASEDNTARNVRVKVSELTLYVLERSTDKWKKLDTSLGNPTWAGDFDFKVQTWLSTTNTRTESDGNLSYKLNADSNPIHGGLPKFDLTKYISPADVDAVFVSIKTQLILDDPLGIDDRISAKIAFSVGADYYPSMTATIADFSPMSYVPMVGSSRYGLVKTVPRTHYMTTIDPPGTYTSISEYTQGGGRIAIPDYEFETNMPGLLDTIAPIAPTSLQLLLKKRKYRSTTSTSVELSWIASTDNVAVGGYNIYRDGKQVGMSTSTTFRDTLGIATGTLYKYTVKAFDAANNLSSTSNEVYTVN